MISETLLLIGRQRHNARDVLAVHADRLAQRDVVDDVVVATYESEPVRELRNRIEGIEGDRVYVLPTCAAHTHETIAEVPAALSYLSGDVRYCEPLGGSPVVSEIIEEKATALAPASPDVSLILVGFGSSSKPYHRQMAEYHATRLQEHTDYADVLTCYLLQNPAVECVRYNVPTERAVAVPLFVTQSTATETRIPEELELARGGIEYADPLGTHQRLTDAIEAECCKQRALAPADGSRPVSFEGTLAASRRPVATDGEGRP